VVAPRRLDPLIGVNRIVPCTRNIVTGVAVVRRLRGRTEDRRRAPKEETMLAPVDRTTAFLRNAPLFGHLADDDIGRIAGHAREIRAPRGTILFHRGEAAAGFYLLVYGQVKLFFTSQRGDEKVVKVVAQGETFGEAVAFDGKAFPVTAQTLADALLLYLNGAGVIAELSSNPRFAARLVSGLCRRIHGLVEEVEACTLQSGLQRVVGYLLRDCDPALSGPQTVTLTTTKGVIASLLNVTQEHFSRILHDLAARGLVEVRGREVRIPDVDRLRGSIT